MRMPATTRRVKMLTICNFLALTKNISVVLPHALCTCHYHYPPTRQWTSLLALVSLVAPTTPVQDCLLQYDSSHEAWGAMEQQAGSQLARYKASVEYWDHQPATYDGVLGGHG